MNEFAELFFPEKNFWNRYFIILDNNKLHLLNKEKNKIIIIIDLEYSKIDKMSNNKKEFKITLKNKKTLKIHSSNKKAWISAIKTSKLHPIIKNLLNKNKSFQKFKIPNSNIRQKIHFCHNKPMSIWQIIKNNIGKTLTKIITPITFNEPLTLLQRSIERLSYKNLIKKANNTCDQYKRISLIFISFIFIYNDFKNRIRKPFNPLLGETFEYISEDFRVISEQVSHHPPIHCGFGDCEDFSIKYCFFPIPSLGLNCVKCRMIEDNSIFLKRFKEEYQVFDPEFKVEGIIQGNFTPVVKGEYKVVNKSTGDVAVFNFKEGLKKEDYYKLDGYIKNRNNEILYDITGFYNDEIKIVSHNDKQNILLTEKKKKNLKDWDKMYYISEFGINLNNLYEDLIFSLPPTDSRFRPDLRAYENGDLILGAEEKKRLECNQRKRKNKVFKPQWFLFERNGNNVKFEYKGNYWECRDSGEWPDDILDIYND